MSFKIKYNLFFLILIVANLVFYRCLLADQGKDVIAERVKNMQKSDQSMALIKRSMINSEYKEVFENARFIRDWAARMKMYFPLVLYCWIRIRKYFDIFLNILILPRRRLKNK